MWPRAYAFPNKCGILNLELPLGERQMPGFLSKIKYSILETWDYGCNNAGTSMQTPALV